MKNWQVHLFVEKFQPATHWVDDNFDPPMHFNWPGNRLLWARCCEQRRPAKNCVVQAYYDGLSVWCAKDKGCRNPKVIKAKRQREFRHRSLGQKRRWGTA